MWGTHILVPAFAVRGTLAFLETVHSHVLGFPGGGPPRASLLPASVPCAGLWVAGRGEPMCQSMDTGGRGRTGINCWQGPPRPGECSDSGGAHDCPWLHSGLGRVWAELGPAAGQQLCWAGSCGGHGLPWALASGPLGVASSQGPLSCIQATHGHDFPQASQGASRDHCHHNTVAWQQTSNGEGESLPSSH